MALTARALATGTLGCKLPIAFVAHRTLFVSEGAMDAGARTSLWQINRRACGGRPMTAAAARRRVFVRGEGGGLGDVSSSTRVRSETLVQRCVLVTVPPHFFCVCPRSFNQALRLSTRWMFGRVNRMVVIGLFGAFFGRRLRRTLRRAWSSAALTDATSCMQCSWRGLCCVGLLQSACEAAAAWCLLRVSQRCAIRQLFVALDAGTNDRRTVRCFPRCAAAEAA